MSNTTQSSPETSQQTTHNALYAFDEKFIAFAKQYYSPIARIALFIIFFVFGFLKLIGLSPASDLALGFADKMGLGSIGNELFLFLAVVECIIGILLLFPKLTRIALLIMFGHMILVCSPLILYPEAVYSSGIIPNLEGQYIIKNAALVALALGLVANTAPLKNNVKKK